MQIFDQKYIDRFWTKVLIQDDNKCWIYTAYRSKKGLGYGDYRGFKLNGQSFNGAHRFSYELYNNQEIPADMVVRHKCDNPGCVNPSHLELGTHQDNIRDRDQRNRTKKGSMHGASIFTEQQVLDIRKKLINRQHGDIAKVAREYKCSHAVICDILKNRAWKHI